MGEVFRAYHVKMGRHVALKVIAKERVAHPTALARFFREVRAVAQLSHPNIVTAFEVNQVSNTHYLAMELVDGIDLARLVQQSGPLPIPRACEYVRQAATGLQHAHEKELVHRDIKPSNLMVARSNHSGPPAIKILDFGLARFESETNEAQRLTKLGHIVGTVDYIAPEQAQNPRAADIRADIFSLGCSLFYLLTGHAPFGGTDAAERISARVLGNAISVRIWRPEVSPALERVLAKIMARNPADRYQTPAEVARALEPHARNEREIPDTTAPVSGRPLAREPKTRASPNAPARVITFREQAPASAQLGTECEPRRRAIAAFWLALAGSAALVAVVVAAIALVANGGAARGTSGWIAPTKDPVGEIRLVGWHSGKKGAMAVAFAPNGRLAVSGGDDRTVRLWDIESGEEIHRCEGHTDLITGVRFTPNGLHVLSWSDDKTLRLWQVETGTEVHRFEHGAQVDHLGVTVTPDGKRVLSASDDKILHVWDLASGEELSRFGFQGEVKHNVWISAFSTDGRLALSCGGDKTLRLWDVEKGTQVRVLDTQSNGGIFSPDGYFALAQGWDAYLRLYDVESGKLIRRFDQGPAMAHSVSFSPDGKRVLASYEHQTNGGLDHSGLWEVQSGTQIYRLPGNPGVANRIVFSPSGRRALTAGRDGSIRLWGLPD
jgi:hypothetical protein